MVSDPLGDADVVSTAHAPAHAGPTGSAGAGATAATIVDLTGSPPLPPLPAAAVLRSAAAPKLPQVHTAADPRSAAKRRLAELEAAVDAVAKGHGFGGDVSLRVTQTVCLAAQCAVKGWSASDRWLVQSKTAFPSGITEKRRESVWMRALVTDALKNPKIAAGEAFLFSRRSEPRADRCPETSRRLRPDRLDHFELRACVVDFDAKGPRSYLGDWGQPSVPCANPACFGRDGKWDSVPAKHSTQTGAPTVVIDGEGRPMPLVSARSKCQCCGRVFAHVNPVTLSRMPPEALRGFPVDLEWAVGDVILSAPLTRAFDYDWVIRQGATNCADKVATAGAETFTRSSERYYAAAQTWWQQVVGLASDEPWGSLDEPGQMRLAEARADFLLGKQLVNRVEPFGKAGDVDGFGLCTIVPKSLLATLASVLEQRRPWRRAQLCSIGCDGDGTNWCSLDFAKRQGEMVGGASWYATLTNGKGDLIGSIVTDSAKVDDVLIAWLTTIGKRPNFKAKVLVVDNTPPAVDRSAWCVALKEAPDVEYILQDKLHVSKNLSKNFNNMHKAYHLLITVGWREAWSYLDRELEQENDARLAMGAVKKDISFRGERIRIVCGTPTSSALIAEWKASGAYHELFTASSVCVAPRRVYSAEVLDVRVAEWRDRIIDYANTSSDARALAPDASNVARLAANALLRVKNCVVPAGACEFRFTGQCDFNGGRGTVAVFHTCHNENWNGIHLDIITGNNLGGGVAGGSNNEGITNRNFRRAIERGEAENVGHDKSWLVERANFSAGHGHGGGGDGFLSIVSQKPYINKRPPDAGPREICVSAVACTSA